MEKTVSGKKAYNLFPLKGTPQGTKDTPGRCSLDYRS